MDRRTLRQDIDQRLGSRLLVWFGTRGDDIEALADVPNLAAAYSVVGAYANRSHVEGRALEDLLGHRVDLDEHDIDDDPHDDAVAELRRSLLRTLSRRSAVVTYRPSTFLSSVAFVRRDRCRYLGMFKDHQAAFEHKPWVESEVARLGIPSVDWHYVADEEQVDALHQLDEGPIVLRRSHSSGGSGVLRVQSRAELVDQWPEEDGAFVSVATFHDGGIPLNVGAVVWEDGVTLHPASVQLIGHPAATIRPFGYCGSDFGAIDDLDPHVVEQTEEVVIRIGGWLSRFGYRGAFGVDFLAIGDEVLFLEVNPRLQGSTHASCQISVAQGESCILLDHLGAVLGLPAPPSRRLGVGGIRDGADLAHLVVHRTDPERGIEDSRPLASAAIAEPSTVRVDVLCGPGRLVEPGGAVARITTTARLTDTGFDLRPPWPDLLQAARRGAGAEEESR